MFCGAAREKSKTNASKTQRAYPLESARKMTVMVAAGSFAAIVGVCKAAMAASFQRVIWPLKIRASTVRENTSLSPLPKKSRSAKLYTGTMAAPNILVFWKLLQRGRMRIGEVTHGYSCKSGALAFSAFDAGASDPVCGWVKSNSVSTKKAAGEAVWWLAARGPRAHGIASLVGSPPKSTSLLMTDVRPSPLPVGKYVIFTLGLRSE